MIEKKKSDTLRKRQEHNVSISSSCTSVSIQGGRSKNEDTADYQTLSNEKWGDIAFCMVADGHGGAAVSKMLKRETLSRYEEHFEAHDSETMATNIENLDQIMVSVIKKMNLDLQGYTVERNLAGGSTLVAVFGFLEFHRLYVLNVGDSRFIMFETKTGEIVHTVSRIIDFEDNLERLYPEDDLHQTCSHLHKVLGRIRIADADARSELKKKESQPGQWTAALGDYVEMENDTPDGRGKREWILFLDNKETNSKQAFEFVHERQNDSELVISRRQLPSTTRAFGDIGMTMHMGEFYICDIPTDREVAVFVGCDGFEESINYKLIPKYLVDPEGQVRNLLGDDHKFRAMYEQYQDWFIHQRIGHFPPAGILGQLTWLLRCVNLVGHSHLPTQRDCEVIAGAVQWLQWAYNKYSSLDNDDPTNKFHKNFRDSARFRLKFVVQCALARLSFDNISGVLVTLTPDDEGEQYGGTN